MAPRTTRSTNKKSKKGNNVEEEDRIEVEIAPLSGILVTLPYETLVEILSLCTPQSLVRMLRTCKAIKGLVDAEERTLYRKLYHNLLSKNSGVSHHYLYSPMKQPAAIEYPIVNYLPTKSIYSWKDQYRMTAQWLAGPVAHCCVKCLKTSEVCEIELLDAFKLKVCALDYAACLVSPSNLSIYQVTVKDVVGIPTVELKTEGTLGNFRQAKFYCSIHLEALGRQKHGDQYTGPKIVEVDEADKKELKDDTVMTACLLHAGVSYREGLYSHSGPADLQKLGQNLSLELNNAANGKPLKKDSGLKKRNLSLVLQDYVRFVQKYISITPIAEQGNPPRFLPASNPGPLIPSDSSIAAYGKVRNLLSTEFLSRYNIFDPRSVTKISALQQYVLAPTDAKWKVIRQIVREEEMPKRSNSLKVMLAEGDGKSWLNMQGIISAMEIAGGAKKLTTTQINRVTFLAQCSAIIGDDSLNVGNAGQLLPEKEFTESGRGLKGISWMGTYHETADTLALLQKVYSASKFEWSRYLSRYAQISVGEDNFGAGMTCALVIQLISSYAEGNNQRVDKELRNRDSVPRKQYEEQLDHAMILVRSGILTSSNIIAYLHQQSQCRCIHVFPDLGRCTKECWIMLIEYEREIQEEMYEREMWEAEFSDEGCGEDDCDRCGGHGDW